MRLCRFGDNRAGLVEGGMIKDVTAVLEALPTHRYPLPRFDPFIAALPRLRDALVEAARTAPSLPLAGTHLLSPVANPGKIVAAPVNYRKHIEEAMADPGIHHRKHVEEIRNIALFLKATSAMIGPGEPVKLRHLERRNDHEIELVAIIGREANGAKAKDALSYVAGYAVGLDMTVRGPEDRSFRKSVDSFAVLGPWMVTADEIPDPSGLDLHLTVNGVTRQKANTSDLLLSVPELIEFASSFYTLHPGDILFTGTPEGVGPVVPGDVMRASIGGIGEMEVRVIAA